MHLPATSTGQPPRRPPQTGGSHGPGNSQRAARGRCPLQLKHLRALVAVATVVLVGLTAAVAILMTDDQRGTSGRSGNPLCALTPKERPRVEALSSLSPAQHAAAFGRGIIPAPPPGTPNDGNRGIFGPPPSAPYDGDPGIFGPPPSAPYDGDRGIFGPPPSAPYDGDQGIFGPRPNTRNDGDWRCLPTPPQRAGFATEMKDEAGSSAASRNRAADQIPREQEVRGRGLSICDGPWGACRPSSTARASQGSRRSWNGASTCSWPMFATCCVYRCPPQGSTRPALPRLDRRLNVPPNYWRAPSGRFLTTSTTAIIPLSSWPRTWQWKTNLPVKSVGR
jgi:hypothetical protein